MKTKIIISFLIFASGVGTMMGQSRVWESPDVMSDTTIVRHWQNEEYIVISRLSGGTGTISYHDNTSGTVITATLPSQVFINDFRIANDSIYAGGYYKSGSDKYALFAVTDINDLLTGTVHINTMYLKDRNLMHDTKCSVDLINRVSEVKRIALYPNGESTRIAFIATNQLLTADNPATLISTQVGFGDVAFLSSVMWDAGSYFYNQDGTEEFTDICATKTQLVVAGRSADSSRLKFYVAYNSATLPLRWSAIPTSMALLTTS